MSFSHNCLHIWLPLWFLLLLVSKMERIKAQKQKLQQKSNSETYKEKKSQHHFMCTYESSIAWDCSSSNFFFTVFFTLSLFIS